MGCANRGFECQSLPAGAARPAPSLWISLWKDVEAMVQTACKPGSVHALRRWAAIPLGRALPCASRDQPGWRGGNAPGRDAFAPGRPSLFGLAPGGVYPATPVTGGAVRSCRTVSPLPSPMVAHGCRAVCFLWHFPWGRPRRPLAGTIFPWSPDFPRPHLRGAAAARPSGGRRMAWGGGEGKPHGSVVLERPGLCPGPAGGWASRPPFDASHDGRG
jgi:hypothetical protein